MANENVQVGKYTLESLTTGMYSDPKIVYREYIQNSVDSLENAVENGNAVIYGEAYKAFDGKLEQICTLNNILELDGEKI